MKMSHFLSLGLICLGSASTGSSAPVQSNYKTINENIVFTVNDSPAAASKIPKNPLVFTMGHQDGSKTREFVLLKNSSYGEIKSLTRHHMTGDGRVGGYFVDEVISKDGKYVLILAGQVHETEQDGKKTYSKTGTWMDSLGQTGTWVDEVQKQHPDLLLAACGGK